MSENFIIFMSQVLIMIALLIAIIYLFRQNVALTKERRIARYTIEPLKNDDNSILDKISIKYHDFIIRNRKKLKKVFLFKRTTKKYSKYITYGDNIEEIDFIINKLVICFAFLILTIFSQVIRTNMVTILELIINIIIGYYIYDVYLLYRQKIKIKKIENEMLRAIMIMNNAFKSGKSTIQAVKIASEELPEPIRDEFKKIYKDMTYGLAVDVVFERFAKRINIEEARYVSSSLTTLNKTGGNIVKVFDSIERTLFDKKKLQEELKNLTVSSNMIVKILLVVPFIFALIIYILNPEYFNPFFDSVLGYMLLGIIFIMFIIYAWFLQKIMKVKV